MEWYGQVTDDVMWAHYA